MARKKRKAEAPEKQITRKEYLRQRKDQREQRALLGVLAPVLVVVAIIVLVGAYREIYSKPRVPVARVNSETITSGAYVDRLAFERRQLLNSVASLASFASSTDPGTLTQLFEGQRTGIADRTVDVLVDEALIRQEAEKRGIEVTEEDVAQKIDDDLATQIAPPPTPEPTSVAASEEGDSELEGVTVSSGVTETTGVTTTSGVTDSTGVAGSSGLTAAGGITDTNVVTSTATDVPTPSREDLDDAFRDNIQPALDQTGLSRAKFENIVRQQLLREKLTEALGAELSITDRQVEVEYLVFGSRVMAEEAAAAVESGNAWDSVVARFRRPEATPTSAAEGEAEALEGDGADILPGEDITATRSITLTEPITTTAALTPSTGVTTTASITDTERAGATSEEIEEPVSGSSEITLTTGTTTTAPITASTGLTSTDATGAAGPTDTVPTATPAPTATPDPYAIEAGERKWFTRDGLKNELGLSDEDADAVLVLAPNSASDPLPGVRGTYVVWVVGVDEAREVDEAEMEQRRQTAIDEWLQKAREAAQIDKFPLEGIIPPEPDWFVQAWERLVGAPQPTIDLSALDLDIATTTPSSPGGGGAVATVAPAP